MLYNTMYVALVLFSMFLVFFAFFYIRRCSCYAKQYNNNYLRIISMAVFIECIKRPSPEMRRNQNTHCIDFDMVTPKC